MVIRVKFSAVPGRSHNLFREFTDLPPDGVEYVHPAEDEVGFRHHADERPPLVQRLRGHPLVKAAYGPFLRHVMDGVGIQDRMRGRQPRGYDVYHSVGSVHPLPEPWVVNLESSLDLFSFGDPNEWIREMRKPSSRRYVERKLLSPWCRRILPETEAARQSVLRTFPDSAKELDAKMEVMQIALRAGPEPRPEPAAPPFRLLFVGSRNFPKDFLPKGGHMVLAAFAKLRERGRDVTLTVRAIVPEPYRSRYERLEGLEILDGDMPKEKVDALYEDHHVFVFPGSSTPGMVIRENMRAARPTLTIDAWANRELVEDGVTGFVAPAPHGVAYTNPWGALNWSHKPEFLRPFEENAGKSVEALADAVERLMDDPALRRRMGDAARREVVSGKFSIAARNAKLKRVYEDAARA